jgi:hypothetical protein
MQASARTVTTSGHRLGRDLADLGGRPQGARCFDGLLAAPGCRRAVLEFLEQSGEDLEGLRVLSGGALRDVQRPGVGDDRAAEVATALGGAAVCPSGVGGLRETGVAAFDRSAVCPSGVVA